MGRGNVRIKTPCTGAGEGGSGGARRVDVALKGQGASLRGRSGGRNELVSNWTREASIVHPFVARLIPSRIKSQTASVYRKSDA